MRKFIVPHLWSLLVASLLAAIMVVYGLYQCRLERIEHEIREIEKRQP